MTMRVLIITGVTGMTGSHLAEYILTNHPKVELYGMCRWRSQMDNPSTTLRTRPGRPGRPDRRAWLAGGPRRDCEVNVIGTLCWKHPDWLG